MYGLLKWGFASVTDGKSDLCYFLIVQLSVSFRQISLEHRSFSHSKQVVSCLRRLVLLDEAKHQFVSEGGVKLLFVTLQTQGLPLCASKLLTHDSLRWWRRNGGTCFGCFSHGNIEEQKCNSRCTRCKMHVRCLWCNAFTYSFWVYSEAKLYDN